LETPIHPVRLFFSVRYANENDAVALLDLMKQLALFEGYAQQFRVTESELLTRSLASENSDQFKAIVAQTQAGELCGYAVVYTVAFTIDLAPTLVLKELFVNQSARGSGVGKGLMRAVIDHARLNHCRLLKWSVLPSNDSAKAFYRLLGGAPDVSWESWQMQI
jgi:ribosomal protein S18 acetylase RimI-like enzyme